MKFSLLFCLGFLVIASCNSSNGQNKSHSPVVHDGDIIFQESDGALSAAIKYATHSKYSHCGIIFIDNGKPYVYEAVQPVKKTALTEWITRGIDGHYIIKSLKNKSLINDSTIRLMKSNCNSFIGKDYDIYFGWSDSKIYCSELVWKIYKNSLNIEVGKVQQLKDFDLSSDIVKQKLKERYGNEIPLNEKVISPQAIFESPLLK